MKIMKWRFGTKSRERSRLLENHSPSNEKRLLFREIMESNETYHVWSNQLEASSRKMIREVMRHRLRSSSTSVQVVLTRTRSLASMRLVTNSWERDWLSTTNFPPGDPVHVNVWQNNYFPEETTSVEKSSV